MHPIEACVRNPVKVAVGALLLILFGLIALARMPMQLTPEVQTPTLTVETRWPGASPQEVEREIVQEQEEQLKSVEGVTKMTSESMDSMGRIQLEFLVGTNMEEALLKVNSRLQQVPEYPEESDEPVITASSSSDRPIAWFILSALQPKIADIEAFAAEQPSIAPELRRISATNNPGLRVLRLRELSVAHPEVKPLLPPDLNVPGMRRFAENTIEARLERVSGVSNANVLGGLEEEMQVVVDPERLAARQLTIDDVRRVLRSQNQDTSAGDFWEGKRRYVVRTINQFRDPVQVSSQVLAIRDGAPVFVGDVADVHLGFKKPDGLVRRFGDSSIAINAVRETGANVLDVMQGLRDAVQELNVDVLENQQLQLTQVYDESDYINSSVRLVNQNIIIGGTLTMLVLMLFLHLEVRTLLIMPFVVASAIAAVLVHPAFFIVTVGLIVIAGFWFARGALVVGLAIPISVIGTFLLLDLWGRSLNVISLAGMAFAVGMLVDNAVVVLENIYRHYQNGKSPHQAAVEGTIEVWGAVLASTLTTLAVFLPVLFVEEEAGQLFRDIALAISAAVGLSLIVSITLIPTATARLLKPHQQATAGQSADRGDSLSNNLKGGAGRFVSGTVQLNRMVQKNLGRRLAVVTLLLAMTGTVSYMLWPKVEYLPMGNRNLVFGIILPPPGYNLDELTLLGETVERYLQPYWDVDPDSPEAANLEFPPIYDFFYVARGRQVFLGVRAVDPTRAGELVPLIQQVRELLPGTFVIAKQSSLFEQGLTAGRTIDVEITGPELTQLVNVGKQVMGKVMTVVPNAQARPVPSLDLINPEVHIAPKLFQSEQMGVDATSLGYAVNALVDAAFAADYYIGGDKIDLTIIGNPEDASRSQDLQSLPIATPGGQLVPLSSLADIDFDSGPEQVNHRERQRAVTIEVSPPPEIALEDALNQIEADIVAPIAASGAIAGGYRIALSGTADKLRDISWNA